MNATINASVLCLIISCPTAGVAAQQKRPGEAGSKPELDFNTADGQKWGMKDLQGKLVLVYFWDWGVKYEEETKQLLKLNEEWGPKGLELIGLAFTPPPGTPRILGQNDQPPPEVSWPHVKVTIPQAVGGGLGVVSPESTFGGGESHKRPWAAIVAPDGTLVWTGKFAGMERFVEAMFKLDKDILDKAHSALKSADVSLKIGKTLDAVTAIAKVPDEARGEYRIRIAAKRLEKEVDKAAAEFIRAIDTQIEAKEYGAAWGQLTTILKAVPESDLGRQAKTRLETLLKRGDAKAAIEKEKRNMTAAAELDAAQRLQSDRKDQAAYAKFKYVAKAYADTPSAAAAAEAMAAYEKDPAFAKTPATAPAGGSPDSKARGMLSMAASYLQSGRTDQAKKKYQDVIDQFPGTTYADTAKAELAKLK